MNKFHGFIINFNVCLYNWEKKKKNLKIYFYYDCSYTDYLILFKYFLINYFYVEILFKLN